MTDSTTNSSIEAVVMSLDERRAPVVAAAKGIVRGGAASLQKMSPSECHAVRLHHVACQAAFNVAGPRCVRTLKLNFPPHNTAIAITIRRAAAVFLPDPLAGPEPCPL